MNDEFIDSEGLEIGLKSNVFGRMSTGDLRYKKEAGRKG
jgi:hypothetical protein